MVTEAVLLAGFGSAAPDCEMKAVLVTLRSLCAGFGIGVATRVAVTLPPLGMLSTVQKLPATWPWVQVNDTRFRASGTGSPNTTPVAAAGPWLVSVIVKVTFSPTLRFLRSATLVMARSATVCAAAGRADCAVQSPRRSNAIEMPDDCLNTGNLRVNRRVTIASWDTIIADVGAKARTIRASGVFHEGKTTGRGGGEPRVVVFRNESTPVRGPACRPRRLSVTRP